MWLHFVSHKCGRLVLPFALGTAAACTPWLPPPLALPAAAGQVLLYGLAIADPWVGARRGVKRLTSPARTFVVLMIAAARAALVPFTGSAGLWTETRVATPGRVRGL
jgi:hypothetical protein